MIDDDDQIHRYKDIDIDNYRSKLKQRLSQKCKTNIQIYNFLCDRKVEIMQLKVRGFWKYNE